MRKIYILALNTFRESIRSKILYSVGFFALLILLASAVFGVVTIGDRVKVLKDFGLFSLVLFGIGYVVITGSALLFKELNRKTIFNILAKPIKRADFVYGKFLGMLMTVAIVIILMSLLLISFLYFYNQEVASNLLLATYSIFLQVMMICALVILVSSIFVTPFLSGAITFGLFVIGRSAEVIDQLLLSLKFEGFLFWFTRGAFYLLPNLNAVDISNNVVHNFPISSEVILWNTSYAITYSLLSVILAGVFFSRREFN